MQRTRRSLALLTAACALLVVGLASQRSDAFCGFYVGGADAKLFNNATMVVMMREGTRTVLSMQNNYQGPPKNFAMVVPVPVVLQKENVKTLPPEIFERIDKLAAPRLVEYWEQDPCWVPPPMKVGGVRYKAPMASAPGGTRSAPAVKIEAQFVVGEYEIVILSANDSAALDAWLRQNKYNIPAGAEPILRPYVQQGMKFFVAKVDVSKVKMKGGQAMLSPLRFYYDTELFALPVRLGLLNSSGTQDLIVHILAKGQRYEVANYDNVTVPTNFEVANQTVKRFGEFYVALFDEVMKRNPKSVVTEYAWDASSCDPCPTPALDPSELSTLGADVLPSAAPPPPMGGPPGGGPVRRAPPMWRGGFVLTRLHTRYSKDLLGEDLVFKQAPPIVGGREFMDAKGKLEHAAQDSQINNFQGRYIIRHPWTGPIACKNPVRGRWGGPPSNAGGQQQPKPALDLAFTPRDTPLKTFAKPEVAGWVRVSKGKSMGLAGSIGQGAPSTSPDTEPTAAATATAPPDATAPVPTSGEPVAPPAQGPDAGCGSCAVGQRGRPMEAFAIALLAAAALASRRRRAAR